MTTNFSIALPNMPTPDAEYNAENERQFRRQLERTLLDVVNYTENLIIVPDSVAIHEIASDTAVGPRHTISGGVDGAVLRASAAAAANLQRLVFADIDGSLLETQIADGALLARVADAETISGAWAFTDIVTMAKTFGAGGGTVQTLSVSMTADTAEPTASRIGAALTGVATHTTGTMLGVIGFHGFTLSNGAGGTTTQLTGVLGQVFGIAGTVTTGVGLQATVGGAGIVNLIGLKVDDVTAGTSSNRAIKTGLGTVELGADVTIATTLDVAGNTTVNGTLDVQDLSTNTKLTLDHDGIAGTISTSAGNIKLSAFGKTVVTNQLQVDALVTMVAAATVGTTFDVTGAVTFGGALTAKAATFDGTVDIQNLGAGSMITLIHDGVAGTISTNAGNIKLSAFGKTVVTNQLQVNALVTMDAAATVGTTFDVTGAATVGGAFDTDGATTVRGPLNVKGTPAVGARFTVTHGASDWTVSTNAGDLKLSAFGKTIVTTAFDVTGASTLTGLVTMSGAATVGTTFDVTGAVTFGGALTAKAAAFDGAVDVQDLSTSSMITLVHDGIVGTISTTGASNLNLSAGGKTAVTTAFDVTGVLTVSDDATFTSTDTLLTVESTGATPGRAQLKLSQPDGPRNNGARPMISFEGNDLAVIAGDDLGVTDQLFNFYSKVSNARTNDVALRVFGNAVASWGSYLQIKHDGTDGIVSTDTGDLKLSASGKTVVTTALDGKGATFDGLLSVADVAAGTNLKLDNDGTNGIISTDSGNIKLSAFGKTVITNQCQINSTVTLKGDIVHQGTKLGLLNTAAVAKQTVTGSRGGNAALASLLTALAAYGLITDSSTA